MKELGIDIETYSSNDLPSKNIEVRIGRKTLKHFVEYLLAYGKQEVEKCKKEFEEL